jgi:hypothetical protein
VPIPWQFNHVIIHLPDFGVWSNPADHSAPFGVLDRELAGKTVALLTEAGGHAVLPQSRPEDFRYETKAELRLERNGTIRGFGTTTATAAEGVSLQHRVNTYDSTKAMVEAVLAANGEGGSGSLGINEESGTGGFLASTQWFSPGVVPLDGPDASFVFPLGFDLKGLQSFRELLSPDGVRKTPLFIGAAHRVWDTNLSLPRGYIVTRAPQNVEFRNAVGSYTAVYTRTRTGLNARRELTVDRNVYAADQYEDVQDLVRRALADTRSIVGIEAQGAGGGE